MSERMLMQGSSTAVERPALINENSPARTGMSDVSTAVFAPTLTLVCPAVHDKCASLQYTCALELQAGSPQSVAQALVVGKQRVPDVFYCPAAGGRDGSAASQGAVCTAAQGTAAQHWTVPRDAAGMHHHRSS